jgi:hypothetical protein
MSEINYNLAISNNYKIEIPEAPEFNYFIQSIQLPALNMAGIDTPYQNWQGAMTSNRIDFDPLTFTYLVAEDYSNYFYIYDWFLDIRDHEHDPLRHFKDINFHILNNNKMNNKFIVFHGCFPTYLGEIGFDSSMSDTTQIVNSATFRYQYFELVSY